MIQREDGLLENKKNLKNRWIVIILAAICAAAFVFFKHTTVYLPYAILKTVLAALVLSAAGTLMIMSPGSVLNWIRQHRGRLIRVLVLETGLFLYMYFFVHRIKTVKSLYSSVQITFSILIMVLIFLVFLFTESRKIPLHRIYMVIGLTMGILFLFMQPPGTVPDEKTHMYAAYDVSNSMMGIHRTPEGSLVMRGEDASAKLSSDVQTGDSFMQYWRSVDDSLLYGEIVDTGRKPLSTQKYQYFMPALGLTLGRGLHLGTQAVFFLGRLFNMIWFVLVTAYAIRLLPFGKTALMVLALTPMTLQQASSFSYDVFINSTAFLLVAVTLQLAYGKEADPGKTEKKYVRYIRMGVLAAACILLFPTKAFVYAPLCFLPLILVVKKWKTSRREALIYVGIMAVSAAVAGAMWILPTLNNTGVLSSEGAVSYTGEAGSVEYTLGYLLAQKDEWIHVLLNTSRNFGDFYLESMIGTPLGWLSVVVNPVLVYVYVVLLVLASLQKTGEQTYIGVPGKLWIHFLAWGSVAAVLLGMLLAYTPVSHQRIEGVQGRYFIPMCLPMLLTIRSDRIRASAETDGPILSAVLACLFFTVHFIIT